MNSSLMCFHKNALILYENLSGHTQIFGEKKAAIQVICYFPVLKSWKMKQGVKFCAHYTWSSHIVGKKREKWGSVI